jgi:hypothetical protein
MVQVFLIDLITSAKMAYYVSFTRDVHFMHTDSLSVKTTTLCLVFAQ